MRQGGGIVYSQGGVLRQGRGVISLKSTSNSPSRCYQTRYCPVTVGTIPSVTTEAKDSFDDVNRRPEGA